MESTINPPLNSHNLDTNSHVSLRSGNQPAPWLFWLVLHSQYPWKAARCTLANVILLIVPHAGDTDRKTVVIRAQLIH